MQNKYTIALSGSVLALLVVIAVGVDDPLRVSDYDIIYFCGTGKGMPGGAPLSEDMIVRLTKMLNEDGPELTAIRGLTIALSTIAASDAVRREGLATLQAMLASKHPEIRSEALRGVAVVEKGRATPLLLEFVDDPTGSVRHEALSELAYYGEPGAASLLRQKLSARMRSLDPIMLPGDNTLTFGATVVQRLEARAKSPDTKFPELGVPGIVEPSSNAREGAASTQPPAPPPISTPKGVFDAPNAPKPAKPASLPQASSKNERN